MKHDLFEFNMENMTYGQRAWRVIFLVCVIGVALMDLLVWRPG
jgi:hypothetical protein